MIIFSWILLLLTGIFGLTFTNINQTQNAARDAERKNDINSIYQKVEAHYNEFGWYPTVDELTLRPEDTVPGLDLEALIDPEGNRIQEGGYVYLPSECSALGCQKYELSAELDNGTRYIKNSLN